MVGTIWITCKQVKAALPATRSRLTFAFSQLQYAQKNFAQLIANAD